jgi:hypothetical protein
MSTDAVYEITFTGDYVEIRDLKSFALTASVAQAIWEEALTLCRVHKCNAVLRVGPLPERHMGIEDVAAAGSRLDIPGLRVAYCWEDFRPDKIAALFATHAMERGVNVRVFAGSQNAIEWLTEHSRHE